MKSIMTQMKKNVKFVFWLSLFVDWTEEVQDMDTVESVCIGDYCVAVCGVLMVLMIFGGFDGFYSLFDLRESLMMVLDDLGFD